MLYKHLRLFLLAMIGVSIAVMPAHAQAASERFRLPKLSFVDVSLEDPAGTVRQSPPFTID